MTDAPVRNTIRSWIDSLTLTQELIVVAGVIFFFIGIASSTLLLRAIAILTSVGLIAYVMLTMRRRDTQDFTKSGIIEPSTTVELEPEMKKLVFDDFQPSGRQYKVEVQGEAETDVQPAADSEKQQDEKVAPTYKFQLSDFYDVSGEMAVKDGGTRSEFSSLMKRVLTLVKEVNFAHTAAFFWVNREKNQLVLESAVTESSKFMTHRRRELGQDIVSQVAQSGQPQVLNDINSAGQLELLGYYEGLEQVKAFIAVPIFYSKFNHQPENPVAVLVVDCLEEDAYGPETLTTLGQFTKLISAIIKSYTDKYDLLLDSELLRSTVRLRDQLKMDFSLHTIVRSLAEETSRLIAWDYIAVVLFDEMRKSWVVQFVMNRMNDPYVAASQEIDPSHSLVGSVIQSSVPKIVDNLQAAELPRYYKAERVDSKGALVIVPMNSINRSYGALVVESKDLKTYSDADVKLIQKLVETASWGLEIFSLTDVVNNYVLLDETTGVATRKYFLDRVQAEVQRANDFDTDLAIVMLSIDSMNEHVHRYGREGFDFVLQNVGRMIKSSIRPYDLVGRFDFNRFGILLVSTSANEAYLWSEKLRKNIASNIINIDQRNFSVTVSAGVCGALQEANDLELLENASQVLKKAVEAGGNIVRVY